MAPKSSAPPSLVDRLRAQWWLSLIGLWLGLALVKLGNPVILDARVQAPSGPLELIFQPWPLSWGWGILGVIVVLGMSCRQLTSKIHLSVWLAAPAAWLLWQFIASQSTVDPPLTKVTLAHFFVCTTLFYLGVFSRRPVGGKVPFAWGILCGFLFVLWVGFDQHFGGLEATRKMVQEQAGWENLPKEYLKRLNSDRVFATLVYPNALAGAVLLFLPVMLLLVFKELYRYRFVVFAVPVGLIAYFGAACMIWSGSKAGWLLSLVIIAVWLWHVNALMRFRPVVVTLVAVVGVCAFAVKYSSYFRKGATSVGARVDYWNAAVHTIKQRPLLGSGPGTFSVMYRASKSPESEMALLAHNDYLEQGSDSGIVGLLAYCCIFPVSIVRLYRKSRNESVSFALWLGLLGWTLQSFVEFGLYIPALSSCSFFFLGWLQGMSQSDESR